MTSAEWMRLSAEDRETIEAHMDAVPIKVGTIAKALGLVVKSSTLAPGISGEIRPTGDNTFTIKVSRHDPQRRQRFTVAHEIGHFLLHRAEIGSGISDNVMYRSSLSDPREAEANRIAADLLMPRDLIRDAVVRAKALGVEDVISYLADQFEVSEAAMRIRIEG